MPEIFLPFGAFAPEGGDVGEGLVRADNAVPIHRGHRPLRQRADQATLAGDGPVTGAFVHIFQAEIAEQESLPSADRSFPVGSDGDSLNAFELLAEHDDKSFVGLKPSAPTVEYAGELSTIADPGVDTGHFVTYRYRVIGVVGAWALDVELGYDDGGGELYVLQADDEAGTGDQDWQERRVAINAVSGDVADLDGQYGNLVFRLVPSGSEASQFGRPAADTALNGWANQAGSGTNVYQSIDEAVASDADYAQSPVLQLGGARSKYRVALTDLVNPFVKDVLTHSYTVRYRYKVTNAGVNVKVTLGYGGLAESTPTVIKSQEHTGITPGSFIAGSFEIEDEIWAIDSAAYEDLWLEFEGHWPIEGSSVATQTVVPTADVLDADWIPSSGATLWEAIDADDGVTVTASDLTDTEQVMVVAIPAVDPGLDTAHILTIKAAAAAAGTAFFRVELLEGTTVRFGPHNFTRTSTALSNEVIPIHQSFIAQIGNYANLRLRITDRNPDGARCRVSYAKLETPEPRRAQISWGELETPSAGRIDVSFFKLSVPTVVTEYQGDKPTIYAGTPNDLYEVDSSGFTEISKTAGGYTSGSAWRFCQVGNHVIATNGVDPVQWREDSTGDFADLITAPSPDPTARFIAPWRERLLLGSIGIAGHAVDEIWVSSANDIQDFEPDETTRAGFEPIRSRPGQIMGLVGGQEGVILKRNNIFQMLYTGGSTLFRIEEVPNNQVGGLAYPSSLVEQGQWYYGHSGECFFRGSLDGVERIGDGAVTRMLTDAENLDESLAELAPGSIAVEDQLMVGARDPKTGLILWTYQAKTDASWKHSRGVLYNPLEDRWAPISAPFSISAVTSIPNTINADSHILKSVIAFSWDDTDTTWFKFSGPTYEVVFDTKLRRLPSSTDAVRDPTTGRFAEPPAEPMIQVRAVRPVFSFPRSTGAVPLPAIESIFCTGWRDADRTSALSIEQEATLANRNDRGIWNFGRGVHGFYHSFRVVLAESATNAVYNLVGLWVDYQVAGSR